MRELFVQLSLLLTTFSRIVALLGLNGHAFGSFKQKEGDYMWLRDDLCRSLPHVRVFIYGYKTEMEGSDSFQSLDDLGLSFKSTLRALLKPQGSVSRLWNSELITTELTAPVGSFSESAGSNRPQSWGSCHQASTDFQSCLHTS